MGDNGPNMTEQATVGHSMDKEERGREGDAGIDAGGIGSRDQDPRKGVLSSSVGLASREAAGLFPLCEVLQSLEFRPGFCLELGRAQLLSLRVWQ